MSVKDRTWFPIAYMFVVTAVFSLVLVGFARLTRDRVEANERLAFEKAILAALPITLPEGASNAAIHKTFVDRVAPPDASSASAYRLMENGRPTAYALPISGRGFWDQIEGIVGLTYSAKNRVWEITGVAVYRQKETPGLGAEIATPRFLDQFDKKHKCVARAGRALTFLPEGAEAGISEVNAITGATQTCTRLERIMNERLATWRDRMASVLRDER